MRKAKKHPVWVALLYIAAAVVLAIAPWAVSGVQAGGHGTSGHPRPLMPGNLPAGTSLDQATPGSTMGTNAQRPAQQGQPARSPTPPVTSVPPTGSSSSMPAQGTVKGSKGAPGSVGDPAGGAFGGRGDKDGGGGR
jgi:hypothetical protein